MKRTGLIILLTTLVIVFFSVQAQPADVIFSGEYYAAGMYLERTSLVKDTAADGPSTAFYFQRLRLNTTFIVHPGLFLITRADIMERSWGASRAMPGTSTDMASSGTVAENENIAWDLAYIQYISPIGIFRAGYQDDGAWGTVFGDSTVPLGKVQYIGAVGPVQCIAYFGKFKEGDVTAKAPYTGPLGPNTDRDIDMYTLAVNYPGKQVQAGLLFKHFRSALPRSPAYGEFLQNFTVGIPYVKAQMGPVALQAELMYGFGKYQKWDDHITTHDDVDLQNFAGWIDATADFGIAYIGGSVAYIAGDDKGTANRKEGGVLTGGTDWNPCLIMFNFDRYYWAGTLAGHDGTMNPNATDNPYLATNNAGMTNAYFFSLRAGIRPIDKLDIMASVSYARADKTPNGEWVDRDYGYEVDATANYKITNNLSYMLGAGYWFVGDYYLGSTSVNRSVADNFMVINKLTLTF